MKKNYLFTLLLTLCFGVISIAQTTLTAGDVVVIQLQTDTPDTFRFVPLVDLEDKTVIKFTENAWDGTALKTNESTITFTANAAISKGTNIEFVAGTTDARFSVNGSLGFSTSGDQLIVYQGDAATPTFIFAVQTNSTLWQTPPTNDTNISALPQGLTDGVNAVAAGQGPGDEAEWDNAYYNGTTTGTKEDLLANVALASNWVGIHTTEYTPITANFTLTNVSVIGLSITSPSDNQVFPAETTAIPVNFNLQNFTLSGDAGGETSDNTGDGYILGTLKKNDVVDGSVNIFSLTGPEIDNAEPGVTYNITAELVDNDGNSLSPKVETSVTFSVAYPCDINLGSIVSTCNAETTGQDTL